MIPADILTTVDERRPAYEVHVCAVCDTRLRIERDGDRTVVVLPGSAPGTTPDDDAWVWGALRAGACDCHLPGKRWRFAPAIPSSPRVTDAEIAERRRDWTRLGHPTLADWAAPTRSLWAATNATDPLHALALAMLAITGQATLDRFTAVSPAGVLDLLEWARTGVQSPNTAAAWLAAGATDAHDAACRTRAGQSRDTIDTTRSGCAALAEQWPGTRPATTECARRLGVGAGPAIARLTVALPTGDRIELYESTQHAQPVLAAVTVDPAGTERYTRRVLIPRPTEPVRGAA